MVGRGTHRVCLSSSVSARKTFIKPCLASKRGAWPGRNDVGFLLLCLNGAGIYVPANNLPGGEGKGAAEAMYQVVGVLYIHVWRPCVGFGVLRRSFCVEGGGFCTVKRFKNFLNKSRANAAERRGACGGSGSSILL